MYKFEDKFTTFNFLIYSSLHMIQKLFVYIQDRKNINIFCLYSIADSGGAMNNTKGSSLYFFKLKIISICLYLIILYRLNYIFGLLNYF